MWKSSDPHSGQAAGRPWRHCEGGKGWVTRPGRRRRSGPGGSRATERRLRERRPFGRVASSRASRRYKRGGREDRPPRPERSPRGSTRRSSHHLDGTIRRADDLDREIGDDRPRRRGWREPIHGPAPGRDIRGVRPALAVRHRAEVIEHLDPDPPHRAGSTTREISAASRLASPISRAPNSGFSTIAPSITSYRDSLRSGPGVAAVGSSVANGIEEVAIAGAPWIRAETFDANIDAA